MLPYYCMTDADDPILRRDYIDLFLAKYPGFLESESSKSFPADVVFDEMIMPLQNWNPDAYDCPYPEEAKYEFFTGDREILKEKVNLVQPNWVKYYGGDRPSLCGYVDGEIASFCNVTSLGDYMFRGKNVKIGAIGSVGTVPDFRRRGIGLAMIHKATLYLKEQGFDYCYIHYTKPATHWYAKLGYVSFVRWNCNGIVWDEE